MEGEATIIENKEETEEILEMLKQKFPTMAFMAADSDNVVIKIIPKICHFTDYTRGVGRKEKIEY